MPARHLQEAEVPIVGNQVCEKIFHHYPPPSAGGKGSIIKDDMLCAGRKGQGSRQVRSMPRPLPAVQGFPEWQWGHHSALWPTDP